MTTHRGSRTPRPDQRIYEAPPLILTRTPDGGYIPVIEPWDPARETARECWDRIIVTACQAIEARKEREAAAVREHSPMDSTTEGQRSPEESTE